LPKFAHKVKTIYFGPNEVFRPIDDPNELSRVREKYGLPENFILSVIRYDEGTKNTRKNFGGMAQAIAKVKQDGDLTHKWVVAGKNCYKYGDEHDIASMGIKDDVIFPGLIPQTDLPAFYSLASLYLYPTIIEAFPIPITEAMTCGCPIITSNATGCDELGADVAYKVEATDSNEIAAAIVKVLGDDRLREEMSRKGLERSKIFSWKKCARETLDAFERVYRS
jgi:glycosyltransferase involved in cell wall biosynthesis